MRLEQLSTFGPLVRQLVVPATVAALAGQYDVAEIMQPAPRERDHVVNLELPVECASAPVTSFFLRLVLTADIVRAETMMSKRRFRLPIQSIGARLIGVVAAMFPSQAAYSFAILVAIITCIDSHLKLVVVSPKLIRRTVNLWVLRSILPLMLESRSAVLVVGCAVRRVRAFLARAAISARATLLFVKLGNGKLALADGARPHGDSVHSASLTLTHILRVASDGVSRRRFGLQTLDATPNYIIGGAA